jgi:Rrf2 family protein
MKLSTKGRYGTRLLLDLALHNGEGPISLKDIARRQEISLPYLERLISPLIAAGIARSSRGVRGGVWLAKPPGEIKLSDVIRLYEGPIAPVECVINPGVCTRAESCVTRDVWDEMGQAMNEVLDSTTIEDLAERQKMKVQCNEAMYHI